jgi:Reverse transcriptase (RNA-dependent DNA polymerase)
VINRFATDAKIFATLDCNSGYFQIPVRPEVREKTTYTSHEGLYWFLRMPFGLRNAPDTFQRFLAIILSGLTWNTCLVYLDDIIVFSKTPADHMAHLDAVLHRLYRAGLTLNLKKFPFLRKGWTTWAISSDQGNPPWRRIIKQR